VLLLALDEVKQPLRAGGHLGHRHLLAEVLLLVECDEGGDAELLGAQKVDALLRGRRVGRDEMVESSARGGDGHVVLGGDGAERAEPADEAGDGAVLLRLEQRLQLARPRAGRALRRLALLVLGARRRLLVDELCLLLSHAVELTLQRLLPLAALLQRLFARAQLALAALRPLVVILELLVRAAACVLAAAQLLLEQQRLALGKPFLGLQRGQLLHVRLALALLGLNLAAQRLGLALEAVVHLLEHLLLLLPRRLVRRLLLLEPRHVLPELGDLVLDP